MTHALNCAAQLPNAHPRDFVYERLELMGERMTLECLYWSNVCSVHGGETYYRKRARSRASQADKPGASGGSREGAEGGGCNSKFVNDR